MDHSEEKCMEAILGIANDILSRFSSAKVYFTSPDFTRKQSVPQLYLSIEKKKHFENSVRQLNVSESMLEGLSELFWKKAQHLRQLFQTEAQRNSDVLHEYEQRGLMGSFNTVLQKMLEKEVFKAHQAIISIVETRTRKFCNEVEASCDLESSGESSVAQKGHSPRAIAILEKVFAQTTNINRTEKLQLARATELEPRQVTIWFQNRRNRKPACHVYSGINLDKKSSTLTQQRKRKFDEVNNEIPQTPTQRRRMSDSDAASLVSPKHRRHETPLSTSSIERSSSIDLFENSQSACSNGSTSCGTSYDDSFSSYQNSSPPRSTFGLNSFDDQVVRFTNAKKSGRSGDDKKEMMFNEDGGVLLDWDDLELNLEDFNDSVSHAVTPNVIFQTNKEYIAASADVVLPTSKEETNDLIMIFARKLVEEQFNAQQGFQQVQQSEGWQSPVFDKIFLAKETEQDVISLAELQSSQSSNPGGPSTSNSTQTSPRSGTPKSLFNFDFDTLGLEDSMQHNNESIEQKIDSIDLFAADETIKFDLLTSDALGLFCSSQTATPSTATNNGTSSLTLLQ